ncbi:hypothetical protein [Teredinibacter turnerae]|uniref:hypothetical protein n=1 Tax=Teredinibacter turnerae TaxID=2426 RepID=UPI00048F6202|nr:hypothetical protein [Teredinibacter turnerae]
MTTVNLQAALGSWPTFLILLLGATLALYLARQPAHQTIHAVFFALYRMLRTCACTVNKTRQRLANRNRDVLLEQGRQHAERDLDKAFFEINKFVQNDLGGYPQLQRDIQETVNRIRDDYDNSREVPTAAPDWLDAVNAIATIKQTDPAAATNGRILEQIHHSAEVQHKENLAAYRKSTANRHRILKAMTPYWRKLAYSVDEVGNRLKEITTRAQSIDQQMLKFNEIVAGSHQAERALKASSITQFVIAALVIAVAAGGAFFNFHLIALPMSEMVGSAQRIGGVKVADLAALVIICLETTAGIFLLESLRITQLFPLIGSMDDRVRRAIMICASCLLLILASTESALAFMRDQIALDLANLRASLAGVDSAEGDSGINSWIPLAANMVLGFILPLALTMVAIPLEYLLQTARTLLGSLAEILLAATVSILRLTASGIKHTGVVVIGLYDLLIAAPLWVENLIRQKQRKAENQYPAQTEEF